MSNITKEQYEERKEKTYQFIKQYIEKYKYAPTYREIAEGVGICLDTAFNHLRILRDENKIDFIDGKARTIKIK